MRSAARGFYLAVFVLFGASHAQSSNDVANVKSSSSEVCAVSSSACDDT